MEPSPAFNVLTAEARDLQKWLQSGSLRSVDLVEAYLQQIQKHNAYLHAVISTGPKDLLLRFAQSLDDERLAHKVRSPLHGIPILLKVSTSPHSVASLHLTWAEDNIATHPSLGAKTTAGSLALAESRVKRNAGIVDTVRKSVRSIAFARADNTEAYSCWCDHSGKGESQCKQRYKRGGLSYH